MTILIWVSAIAFVAMVTMVGIRIAEIRLGKVVEIKHPSLHSIIQPKIDFIAYLFVVICRDISKFVSLHVLVTVHRAMSFLKVALIKSEKKFSRVIDAVHGRGPEGKRESASFFLVEIQRHAEQLKLKNTK